eukprot:2005728-Prymnesium_polylepis.1
MPPPPSVTHRQGAPAEGIGPGGGCCGGSHGVRDRADVAARGRAARLRRARLGGLRCRGPASAPEAPVRHDRTGRRSLQSRSTLCHLAQRRSGAHSASWLSGDPR